MAYFIRKVKAQDEPNTLIVWVQGISFERVAVAIEEGILAVVGYPQSRATSRPTGVHVVEIDGYARGRCRIATKAIAAY